jgi:hypothetical protein
MRNRTVSILIASGLIIILWLSSPTLQSAQSKPSKVRIEIVQIERVYRSEVQFRLKLVNESDKSVFVEGSTFDSPVPEPLYIEQWQAEKGWHIVVPCVDTAPGDVIKLRSAESLAMESRLATPLPSVCKERNPQFEGKFRFRLDYFASEKAARTHEENFFTADHQPRHTAMSEPFEIPPLKE